jgi:PBP1b-binding outer membrane lipoprotein LpoB
MLKPSNVAAVLLAAVVVAGCSSSQEPAECESVQTAAGNAELRNGPIPECEPT